MSAGAGSDVAIIGGGICGMSMAAILAADGARVTVHEREAVAAGASGRNSGVVQRPLDPALVPLYERTVAVYRELAEEAPDAGFALPAEPSGLLLATFRVDGLPALLGRLETIAPELEPAIVDGPALRSLEPALADGVAAIRLPIGFPVVPSAPTYAMATLAERRGATIRLGRPVEPVVRDGRVIGVSVDGRLSAADVVVIAAGPWTSALVDPTGAWRPITPAWGVVVETLVERPPRHVIEEAGMDAVLASDDGDEPDEGPVQPDPDVASSLVPVGGICAVGSTFLDGEPVPSAWGERILDRGRRFVPALYDAPIREVRACARPRSFDGRPILGPMPGIEGLFLCSGHGPWGISTGPGSAALVADLIAGREAYPPGDFSPTRTLVSSR